MSKKEWAAFIVLSLAWGSSFLFIKIALEEVGPFTLMGARVAIGASALVLTALAMRSKIKLTRNQVKFLLVIALFHTAMPYALIAWAEIQIDSGVASILSGTVPLFTAIIAYFWLKEEKLPRQKIIGLLIGFVGVIVVIARDGLASFQFNIASQVAILVAASSYAYTAIYIRKKSLGIPLVIQAAGTLIFASLMLWAGALIFESPIVAPTQSLTWIALLWLGIVGTFVAYLLYFYLLNSAGPTKAVMVTYIFPVIGVALGVLVLGESLNIQMVFGTVLVISSVVIVNK